MADIKRTVPIRIEPANISRTPVSELQPGQLMLVQMSYGWFIVPVDRVSMYRLSAGNNSYYRSNGEPFGYHSGWARGGATDEDCNLYDTMMVAIKLEQDKQAQEKLEYENKLDELTEITRGWANGNAKVRGNSVYVDTGKFAIVNLTEAEIRWIAQAARA